jgi:hypothetical protein
MPKKPMRRIRRSGKLTEDRLFSLENGFCLDGQTPDYGHPLISRLWDRQRSHWRITKGDTMHKQSLQLSMLTARPLLSSGEKKRE